MLFRSLTLNALRLGCNQATNRDPVVDYDEAQQLATATGTPLPLVLERLRRAGATSVAIGEATLESLEAGGFLRVDAAGPTLTYTAPVIPVTVSDPALFTRLYAALRDRCPDALVQSLPSPPLPLVQFHRTGGESFRVLGTWDSVKAIPVGFDPAAIAAVRRAGMQIVARPLNYLGATPGGIDRGLRAAAEAGARVVVFAEEEVLGYRFQIRATADALVRHDLLYGAVEFGKQKGDLALQQMIPDRVVRVHSIPAAEMSRLALPEAIERYVRGAAERNIRVCYVRLPNAPLADTLADSLRYVNAVRSGIVAARLGIGAARPWPALLGTGTLPWPLLVVALGIAGLGALLGALVYPLRGGAQLGLFVIFAGIATALVLGAETLGREALALAAAIGGPVAALAALGMPPERNDHAASRPVGIAVRTYLLACMGSVLVGVLVAAILGEREYFLKIESFVGIKLAHVAPLLLLGVLAVAGTHRAPDGGTARRQTVVRLQRFLAEPLRLWHAAALIVVVVALSLLLLRTGNEPGVGVPDWELRLRSLLDRVLLVRPRFKEFLLGHPALLVGLYRAARGGRWAAWALPLILVGAIGQVSIVNTFCHLHTPLKVTLIRVFHGIWLGGAIGLLLVAALTALERRIARAAAGASAPK